MLYLLLLSFGSLALANPSGTYQSTHLRDPNAESCHSGGNDEDTSRCLPVEAQVALRDSTTFFEDGENYLAGPREGHVRAISMFITAYAYTEYCLEGPEAAACAVKHVQALLSLIQAHRNFTGQVDVLCCYLAVGRDFILRNTHLVCCL